jgi:hypothetical protein
MTVTEDIQFHCERAQAERDRAGSAASVPAARAHLALAELHMERARALRASLPALLEAAS